jgi:mycothiol synthase
VSSPDVRPADSLTPTEQAAVASLQERAVAADGVRPLSEQSVLSLTSPPGRVRHFLGYAADDLVGYAQLTGSAGAGPRDGSKGDGSEGDAGEGEEPPSAELVVDPDTRLAGHGSALLAAVLDEVPSARLWAHGDLPAARAFAEAKGLQAVRELHKMSRALGPADLEPATVALPEGFTARAFEPGRDEEPWLATNASAFAHHAEQGRLTLEDLHDRMSQPWFDPTGFIVLTHESDPDAIAAFHWTKVDPEQESTLEPGRTAGEVYVVGVDPAYQGRGLGRPLTALGLAHLARLGLPEVVLYVDGDNTAAIRTYTGLGFRSIMVDVMYSHAVHQPLSG